jgi:general secretion pathway protein F
MSRGESLGQALEAERRAIPPLYWAIVEAGTRAGRLPAALEGLTNYVRGIAEARRSIGLALLYPTLVAGVAYGLFLGLVTIVVPRLVATMEDLSLTVIAPVRWLETIGRFAPYWWPIGPLILLGLLLVWFLSGRASRIRTMSWSPVRLIPGARLLLKDYESANFSGLLALLVENGVTLPEALTLAGEASGDPRLVRETATLAEALRRGESVREATSRSGPAITPLVRWAISAGSSQGPLAEILRGIASTYRTRARVRSERLRVLLPIVFTFAIAAGATLLYGLALFIPLVNLLDGLGLQ